MTAYKLQI